MLKATTNGNPAEGRTWNLSAQSPRLYHCASPLQVCQDWQIILSLMAEASSTTTTATPEPKIFRNSAEVKSVETFVVWLSPAGCGAFTGISQVAEMCPGRQASSLLYLGKWALGSIV